MNAQKLQVIVICQPLFPVKGQFVSYANGYLFLQMKYQAILHQTQSHQTVNSKCLHSGYSMRLSVGEHIGLWSHFVLY